MPAWSIISVYRRAGEGAIDVGTFETKVAVGRDKSGPFTEVTALVDTGATYSMLPSALLRELGVEPGVEREFTMADGRRQRMSLGEVRFRIDPSEVGNGNGAVDEVASRVVFGPPERFLIGAVTLQMFGLIADTTHHKLIPAPELTL